MLLGVALLVIDVHVTSHGALTVAGLISLAVGSLLLFQNAPGYHTSAPLVVGVAVALGATWAFAISKAVQVRHRPVAVGPQLIAGSVGEVRGEGLVYVNGELESSPWTASSSPFAPNRHNQVMSVAIIIVAVLLFLVALFLFSAIKVAREYERGIVFRLGRLLPEPKGPGLFLLIPIVDRMVKVDLRTITLTIPPQEVITKDNVPVRVNAVAYFRIVAPKDAIVQIENYMVATSQIAQTTLRSVLGQHVLDELLSEREKINGILQGIIDESTAPWGIKVSIVEVKDVEIPSSMQRAMARQAEAERERRAKIINAEGEFQAAERLKDAAAVIGEQPVALQLRYLQTLLELGSSQATTIVFPVDLIRPFLEKKAGEPV
jgi:regulator of protease activity HflC (stomatin/prohibitin superfamily)